eukprot:TRINITY_DN20671_c0_g1_i1.p1 TRINITY_DN20671_c0_g1~~TRINITY_DN20671_c0_g1_i1.p1  ORF type:complete len:614 (+),score=120.49 TRINITY_DN20671_c0_g1_i1:37-1842(+)
MSQRRCCSRRKIMTCKVQLSTGCARGEVQAGQIGCWTGIPFAAAPTGKRRWKRPEPAEKWEGELDCTAGRPGHERRGWPVQDDDRHPTSEDCLHLNVWAPVAGLLSTAEAASDSKPAEAPPPAPVLLWIYGGGLVGGSKDDVNSEGRVYAERGVIFVSCNYRVGALGFLCPEGGDPNCGLWDQVAALRWIQDEIGAFGGDPSKVTIMGQSAGADSCYWLCSSPVANKLFHRAIIQSPASFLVTLEQARELAEEFASVAGAKSPSLEDMQALSVEQLMTAQKDGHFNIHHCCGPGWRLLCTTDGDIPEAQPEPCASASGLYRLPSGVEAKCSLPVAVLDGELLLDQPLNALRNGVAAHLDIVVGGNRDEDAWMPSPSDPERQHPDCYGIKLDDGPGGREEVIQRLVWEIAGMPATAQASAQELRGHLECLVAAYEEERAADVYQIGPQGTALSPEQWLMDVMLSDFSFLAAVHLITTRLALPGCSRSVYRYQFNGFDGAGDAFHAAELQLQMGETSANKKGKPEVREAWLDSWTAFVKTGDPNIQAMAGTWRQYSDGDQPVLFWDGISGWRTDGGPAIAKRKGLQATARLWSELWRLQSSVQ